MAKFEECFESTQELFTKVIENADLHRYINIAVLTNNKAKELFTVTKTNDLLKYRTNDDVVIILNERIFEQLTDEQQLIVVESAIAYVSYDNEKGKVVITKPDFKAHRGILRKYSFDTIEVLEESIKTLYQAEKEAEDASKAQTEKASKHNSY